MLLCQRTSLLLPLLKRMESFVSSIQLMGLGFLTAPRELVPALALVSYPHARSRRLPIWRLTCLCFGNVTHGYFLISWRNYFPPLGICEMSLIPSNSTHCKYLNIDIIKYKTRLRKDVNQTLPLVFVVKRCCTGSGYLDLLNLSPRCLFSIPSHLKFLGKEKAQRRLTQPWLLLCKKTYIVKCVFGQ